MVRSGENIPLQSPSQMSQPLVFLLGRIVFQIPFPEVFFRPEKIHLPKKTEGSVLTEHKRGICPMVFSFSSPKKGSLVVGPTPSWLHGDRFFFVPSSKCSKRLKLQCSLSMATPYLRKGCQVEDEKQVW